MPLWAQDDPPQEPATPSAEDDLDKDSAEEGRDQLLPRLDFYFPEGRLDFRLSRLIKNAFFEGQVKYNFVRGDISAFLRYRYYGYRSVSQIGVFDAVEFENVEEFDNDFERVRGLLYIMQWPYDYHHRAFFLAELDRLSSSKEELRFDNNRTNTFVRFSFQRGTPNDRRSNAIVGETRARVEDLFSVHNKIGPDGAGLTAALTYGFDFLDSDFNYVRLDLAALKRYNVGRRNFAIARLQAGTFLHREEIRDGEDVPEADRYSIPRSELFRLGGRENLKGVDNDLVGTELGYATNELFLPWFEDSRRRFLWVDWENFFWVLYGGVGSTGFGRDVFSDTDSYYFDVGVGAEASFRLKDYTIFLSGLVAHSFGDEGGLETHFSLKSYH